KTFAKQKDANEYRDTVGVNIRAGVHSNSKLTIAEAGEAWIKRCEADGLEATTIRQYRQHLNLHIAPRIGKYKLGELAPGHIESFRDELLKKLSRPLGRKVLVSLKSLLKTSKHVHVAADVLIRRRKRDEHKLEEGKDFPTPA